MNFITFGNAEEESAPPQKISAEDMKAASAIIKSYQKFWTHGKRNPDGTLSPTTWVKEPMHSIDPLRTEGNCRVFKVAFADGSFTEAKTCRVNNGYLVSAYWTDKSGENIPLTKKA